MKKILHILSSIRPEEDFTQSDDFIKDGLLDSFDVVLLVSDLEKTFLISIDGLDIVPENLNSIPSILELLKKYDVTF